MTDSHTRKFPDVWVFDRNRRVYETSAEGYGRGGPIYREHWTKREIVGETARSWITKCGCKLPKKGGHGVVYSEGELEDDVFLNDNRYPASRRVTELRDAEALRKIIEILNSAKP